MKEKITPPQAFSTRGIIKGVLLFVLYFAVVPVLTSLLASLLEMWTDYELSEKAILLIPYYTGFLLTVILFREYLIENLRSFFAHFGRSLFSMILSYFLLLLITAVMFQLLAPFLSGENPNESAVDSLIGQYDRSAIVIAVLLIPLIEETLFRGMVFGTIWNKNRFLGYLFSFLLFGAAHVLQYAILSGNWKVMVFMIDYLPASIALAYCYRRSGSIWAAVFLHMFYNGISMWASLHPMG